MVYVRQGRLTQAAELLDGIILELQSAQPNLTQCCQDAIRVCHLLDLDDDADQFESELKGYPSPEDVPTYRIVAAGVLWGVDGVTDSGLRDLIIASNAALADSTEQFGLTVTLPELTRRRNVGYLFHTGRRSACIYKGATLPARQYMQILPVHIELVLDNVAAHAFSWASRTKVATEHERSVGRLFEDCVTRVEECLAGVGLEGWVRQIREGMGGETPEGNASAVLACRNLITELADHILQVDVTHHPTLKDKDGKDPMSLSRDKVKNRYRAYLHETGLQSQADQSQKDLERLVDCAVDLYDEASKGKRAIGEGEMRACVARTYLFIAELDRLTALLPVYDFAMV